MQVFSQQSSYSVSTQCTLHHDLVGELFIQNAVAIEVHIVLTLHPMMDSHSSAKALAVYPSSLLVALVMVYLYILLVSSAQQLCMCLLLCIHVEILMHSIHRNCQYENLSTFYPQSFHHSHHMQTPIGILSTFYLTKFNQCEMQFYSLSIDFEIAMKAILSTFYPAIFNEI